MFRIHPEYGATCRAEAGAYTARYTGDETMNSEKREAAAQATMEQAENTFLRVWTSREAEKQDTAEYLGCSCSINTAL